MSLEKLKTYLQKAYPKTVRFQVDWFLSWQIPKQIAITLVAYAKIENGKNARLIKMTMSNCHKNAEKLNKKHPKWTRYFGLAISEDGIWRVHSWLKNTKGRIIETTIKRTKYFGLPL